MLSSTELSLRRYLYLHAALLFLLTSTEGFSIFKHTSANKGQSEYVRVHLDGFITALWLGVIAGSLDYSTLTFRMKRVLGGAAIVFSWAQLYVTYMQVRYTIPTPSLLALTGEWRHDSVSIIMWTIMVPSALVASGLWAWGFVRLHEGERGVAASGTPSRRAAAAKRK